MEVLGIITLESISAGSMIVKESMLMLIHAVADDYILIGLWEL